jgi:protein-S-isoprenylcysteine O-methyltransferase Ste14
MKGKILVAVQFVSIALLAFATRWILLPWWTVIFLSLSALLLVWAVLAMRPGNFNVIPTPVETGVMVSRGPYRLIRHPMYTSIFIVAITLLAAQFDYTKLSITLVMVTGLVVKMIYEESLLCEHFPDYKNYMKETKRVIPFIW